MNFKKPFTLLEVLIGFSILAAVSSVSTYWVYKKLQKDRFFSEVERLEKSIKVCQKIARIRNEDLKLVIYQKKNTIFYEVENHPLLPSGKNLIRNANFLVNSKKISKITLEAYYNQKLEPNCQLSIVSKNKDYKKVFEFN